MKPTGLLEMLFNYGFRINALLTLFNMIPFMLFDGAKVLAWKKNVFYMTAGIALLLFIGNYFI